MSNQLQIFNYQSKQVRTVTKDGEPWFVAKDICDILELGNSRMALERLDNDEKGVSLIDTPKEFRENGGKVISYNLKDRRV